MKLNPMLLNNNPNVNNYKYTAFGNKFTTIAKNYQELEKLMLNSRIKTLIVDWNISNQEVKQFVQNWYSRGGTIQGGNITNRGGVGFFEEFHHSHLTENSESDKRIFIDYLNRFIKKEPSEIEILDAGCGEGKEVRSFLDYGYKVSGFDASLDCVNTARKNSNADIICAGFNDFKSPKLFDAIWTRKALQHVAKSGFADAVQNLVNHLKQNGFLFAITKLDNQPINGVGRQIFNENRLFHNFFTERELQNVCSNIHGVKVVNIKPIINHNAYDISDTGNILFVLKKD